jgi:hypothetical protein
VSGFAAAAMLQAVPVASAAELVVTRAKRIVHHRSRVVADHHGTPIVLRRTRLVIVRSFDGAIAQRGSTNGSVRNRRHSPALLGRPGHMPCLRPRLSRPKTPAPSQPGVF